MIAIKNPSSEDQNNAKSLLQDDMGDRRNICTARVSGKMIPFSIDHLQRYSRIIQEAIAVRRHLDLLRWLQGEVQQYLPHEIMLAAWGNFGANLIQYDIVSTLPGVRTAHLEPERLSPLLRGLYQRWGDMGRMPCAFRSCSDTLYESSGAQCAFGGILQGMRSSLLHGIRDRREHHDRLYVIFSSHDKLDCSTLGTMAILMPHIDAAFSRVAPLSRACQQISLLANELAGSDTARSEKEAEMRKDHGRSKHEVATWVE